MPLKKIHKLYPIDIATLFGTSVKELERLDIEIKPSMFKYTTIEGNEYNQLVLEILKEIDNDKQLVGEPDRTKKWNDGWNEIYNEFVDSRYDISKLTPKYIKSGKPLRLFRQYIRTENPNFELDIYKLYREFLFKKYLHDIDTVYEFGCGTGYNLIHLSEIFPHIKLYGMDFVQPPLDILELLPKHYEMNITGRLFDMKNPDYTFTLDQDSAVITFGSVEQLPHDFKRFIDYLIQQPISICIHAEPMIEMYDLNNLNDYIAYKFQDKRRYSKGISTYIRELSQHYMLHIVKEQRVKFGSTFIEGYNYVIWKPTKSI